MVYPKREAAVALAEEGFYVFRLIPNGKTPAFKGWPEEATCDPEEVLDLWQDGEYNIGIYTAKYEGGALVAVDVDTKPGKVGAETFEYLKALDFEFPETREARTASGGRHLIYRIPQALRSGNDKLGKHIDIKSKGGYIAAQGSTIDEKSYQFINDLGIANCPEWIIEKVGYWGKSEAPEVLPFDDEDPSLEARAIQYLENEAPQAIEGSGGDWTTYKIALVLRDFGLSRANTLGLMYTRWNGTKAFPLWTWDELEKKVESAYNSAQLPIGNRNPKAVFSPLPDEPFDDGSDGKRKERNKGLYYKKPGEITLDLSRVALIEDLLDPGATSVMYGDSNQGKTFVAMDIAFHIATGRNWHTKRVQQGPVVYIAAEGGKSAENRITALKMEHGLDDFPLYLIPCPIDLLDPKADCQKLVTLINEISAKEGVPVQMVVIDTLSRAIAGGNENDAAVMGAFVRNFEVIRSGTGAHIMIIHHTGKDAAKGARGHSLLRAAVDTEIEIVKMRIKTTKQRDMEFGRDVAFTLKPIELGVNYYGKPIKSCVILKSDASASEAFEEKILTPRAAVLWSVLLDLEESTPASANGTRPILTEAWKQGVKAVNLERFPGCAPWPLDKESFNKAFSRARTELETLNYVEQFSPKQWVKRKQDKVGQDSDDEWTL